MPNRYVRLAVERSIANDFYKKIRKIGRKPSEVINAMMSAVVDAIDHGIDPLDMIHICRIARSVGIGRSGFDIGLRAGVLLRAYYTPTQLVDVLSRIGPAVLGIYRVGANAFRATDERSRETARGLLVGIGCKAEADHELLRINCNE
ncbi:MAG: hypothetical protein QXP98_07760 [Thermoproteus sp.]